MIPAQLLPLLGYDDYLGIAREGTVVVPVERRAVIGTITTRPKYRGTVTTTPKYLGHLSVRPRISTRGGGVISNEAALFAMQKAALFQDPLNTLDEFKAFIARFVDIINGDTEIIESFREYLLTEGRSNVNMEDVFGLDELGAPHLLYWLNRKLRERQDVLGWTDRLSEIGWGEESPDNLGDADPFDLVTTLEGLDCHVLVCDSQAVDDGDATSANGPIQISPGTNNTIACYRINAGTVTSGTIKSPSTLFSGDNYVYKYIGGFPITTYGTGHNILRSLHESGNTNGRRYALDTRPVIVLFKGGNPYISADSDIRFGRPNADTADHNPYILWRSYPGENVTIRGAKLAASGMSGKFILGINATAFRKNVWFDGIKFEGRVESSTPGTYNFANRILEVSGVTTGVRVLRCEFDWIKAIAPDDPRKDEYPEYIDQNFAAKVSAGSRAPTFITCRGKGLIVHKSRLKCAGNELPRIADSSSDEPGHAIDLDGIPGTSWSDRGATISQCLIEGQAGHAQIRFQGAYRYAVIEDCDISNGDNSCIVGFELAAAPGGDVWIRRNRIHDWGVIVGAIGAANGIQMKSVNRWIVEDNVVWNTGNDDVISINGISIQCDRVDDNATHANSDNHIIRRNIVYKCQVSILVNGGNALSNDNRINSNEIASNIIVDFDEDDKSGTTDGPVYINLYDPVTNLLFGNSVTGNLISYDTTYDSADPIASVRTGAATQTDVTQANQATMPGFSGNFVANPQFANVGAEDFTPSLTAARNLLDLGAIPLVSTPVWNAA